MAKLKATNHVQRRRQLAEELERERLEHLKDIGLWAEQHGLDDWDDDELKAAFRELAEKRAAGASGAKSGNVASLRKLKSAPSGEAKAEEPKPTPGGFIPTPTPEAMAS